MNNKKIFIIQVLLSILIFSVLVYHLNTISFDFSQINFKYPIIFLTIFVFVISILTRSHRWRVLINHKQLKKISSFNSLKLLLLGQALNMITPAGSGDVIKGYFGYKWFGNKERMISISLLDKVIAILSLFYLALFAFFLNNKIDFLIIFMISFSSFLVLFFSKELVHNRNVIKLIDFINVKTKKINFKLFIKHFVFNKPVLIYTSLISVLGWLLDYLILFLCFKAMGINIELKAFILIGPILTIGRLFPFTLNGIGTDEALIVYMFSHYTRDSNSILITAILFRLLMLILPALLGLLVLLTNKTQYQEAKKLKNGKSSL